MRLETVERFEDKCIPEPNSGCWIWIACLLGRRKEYGSFKLNGQTMLAHRVAWILYLGPIPENMHVLHKCDVPCCVNPDHLFLGTHADNMADMTEKGRQTKGLKNGRAKLTEPDILKIRHLYEMGVTQQKIGERFGISRPQVGAIVHGRRWKHITCAKTSWAEAGAASGGLSDRRVK